MAHALAMASLAILLLALTFAAWRLRDTFGALGVVLAVPWTLWFAEMFLTALPKPTAPLVAPAWRPDSLPPIAGHAVPRGFGADPDGPTVAIVGDSFAAGQGVTPDETLGAVLQQRMADQGVTVVTHATPSRSLWDLSVTHAALTTRLDPQVLVWTVVLNDVGLPGTVPEFDLVTRGPARWRHPFQLVERTQRAWSILTTTSKTTELYQRAWDPDGANWRDGASRLDAIVRAEEARGVRVVVLIWPLLHQLDAYPFDAAHAEIARVATAAGAEVLDVLDLVRGEDETGLWASRADHHPNAVVHARAATALGALLGTVDPAPVGPPPCADLPVLPGLEAVTRTACAEGSPEALLALADALVGYDPFGAVDGLTIELASRGLAADLATVVAHRALAETERDRAVALIAQLRRGT